MASRVKELATGLAQWFKKPWQITGPVSGAEYLEAVPNANEFRVNSPATQLQRAIVPHGQPERVFDIKYYVRDNRRRPPSTTVVDVSVSTGLEGSAPTVSKFYTMGKEFPITDEPGEGYQK